MCICNEDEHSKYVMKGYLECRWWEYCVKQDIDITNMRIHYCPFCGRCLDEEGGIEHE